MAPAYVTQVFEPKAPPKRKRISIRDRKLQGAEDVNTRMMVSEQLRRGRGSGIQRPTEASIKQPPSMGSSHDDERFQRGDSEARKLWRKAEIQKYAADEARDKRDHPERAASMDMEWKKRQTYVQHPTPPASSPPVYSPQRERGPSHSAFKGTTSSRSIDSHPRKYDGSGHQSGSLRRAAHCGEGLADTACKEDPRLEMAEILKQQMTLFEQQQILGATLASITEATFASITEALASQQSMRRMEEMFREARDWHLKARNQRLPPSMAAAVVPRPMPRSEAVLEVNERPPAVLQSTLRQQPKNATAASASHGMTLRKKMPQAELVLPSIEKIEEDWGDREEPTALDLVVSDIVGESERELVDDVASSSAKANIKIERIQEEDSRKDEDNDAEHEEDAEEGNDDEYEQESAAVPVPVGMKRKADGQATGPPRLKKQTYHNIGKRISTSEIPNPFLEKAEEELRKRQRRLGATGARSRVHRR